LNKKIQKKKISIIFYIISLSIKDVFKNDKQNKEKQRIW